MTEPLVEIAALVKRETGVVVKDAQLPGLEAIVGRVAPGKDPSQFLEELADPASGQPLLSRLVDQVTIQETYFFRESRDLQSVDWNLLLRDARVGGGESVRVWVPACATGEEAYTLAMLAIETFRPGPAPVTILATDVASTAIESALAGLYSPRSVRNVPPALREQHFSANGKEHLIRDPIKSMVHFRRHNLVTEPSPPAGETPFDLIVCRNVLIYFDNETVQQVVGSLESALRPGGELILGAADRMTGTTARLLGAPVKLRSERRQRPARPGRGLRRPLGLPVVEGADAGGNEIAMPNADHPRRRASDRVEAALWAADAGDLDRSLEITAEILEGDPHNADALFVRGLAELGLWDAESAVTSLRRSLYIDPAFGLAAFELGRAHDAAGDHAGAQRAYERALRTLDPADDRHSAIVDQVEMTDVAAACRLRLDSGRVPAAR